MPTVTFVVPGTPVAQPRPRVTVKGSYGRAYVPSKHPVHAWRERIALCATAARHPEWPLVKGVPLWLTIRFIFTRPQSVEREYHTITPDIDNLAKAVLDAMSGSEGAAMVSDAAVVGLNVHKKYGLKASAEVEVKW